jgi:hypothetical protein
MSSETVVAVAAGGRRGIGGSFHIGYISACHTDRDVGKIKTDWVQERAMEC